MTFKVLTAVRSTRTDHSLRAGEYECKKHSVVETTLLVTWVLIVLLLSVDS